MLLLKQATCCPVYAEELSNISTCNVVGNMFPTNETFLIHWKHVSSNKLLETFHHTLGKHVAGNMFPATCFPKCCLVYGGLKESVKKGLYNGHVTWDTYLSGANWWILTLALYSATRKYSSQVIHVWAQMRFQYVYHADAPLTADKTKPWSS